MKLNYVAPGAIDGLSCASAVTGNPQIVTNNSVTGAGTLPEVSVIFNVSYHSLARNQIPTRMGWLAQYRLREIS